MFSTKYAGPRFEVLVEFSPTNGQYTWHSEFVTSLYLKKCQKDKIFFATISEENIPRRICKVQKRSK